MHTFYSTDTVYRYSVTYSWLNLTEIFLSTLSRSMILVNKSRTSSNVTHESLRCVPWACKLHGSCFFLSYSLFLLPRSSFLFTWFFLICERDTTFNSSLIFYPLSFLDTPRQRGWQTFLVYFYFSSIYVLVFLTSKSCIFKRTVHTVN